MTRRRLLIFLILAMPICVVAAQSTPPRTNGSSEVSRGILDVAPSNTDCAYNFGTVNSNLRWCISEHGNLMRFTSPRGQEHIRVGGFLEGYVLCTRNAVYRDLALVDEGWGAPTLLSLTSASVTIRRETNDGHFRLDQRWIRDSVERELIVRMTLRNLGAGETVTLMRSADPDVDNDYHDDFFDRSTHSGWARDVNALTMSALTLRRPHAVVIDDPALIHEDCSPLPAATPGGRGDPGISIIYRLGTMRSGAVQSVEVSYRAQ
jgi:hypothetical protein